MAKTSSKATEQPTITSVTFAPEVPETQADVLKPEGAQSPDDLRHKTQELATRRIEAQKALQKNLEEQKRFTGVLGGLRQIFDRDGSARERLAEEHALLQRKYDEAEQSYQDVASEFIITDANAREALMEDEVRALAAVHKAGGGQEVNPVVKTWRTLNTWNSEWSAQKILGEKLGLALPNDMDPRVAGMIRFAGKMITPRTAIALGLVGVGFGAFGIAAKALDAGLGAVAGLAAMRGLGIGVASRDVLQWAREELPLMKFAPLYDKDKPLLQRIQLFEKLTPEMIDRLSPEEVKQRFLDASSAITLYGKTELLEDPRYQALLKGYSSLTAKGQEQFLSQEGGPETPEAQSGEAERKADLCMKFFESTIPQLDSDIAKVQKEKKVKGVGIVALLTTAAVVLPGLAHLRRLTELHPEEMAQLAKAAGKTIQDMWGAIHGLFELPAHAEEAPATQGQEATDAETQAGTEGEAEAGEGEPAGKEAGGGGGEAETWGKKIGKGFSVSGAKGDFVALAKIGGEGLLEKTAHQDQVLRVFLSRAYGDWLAQKYGGTIPKHALDAIENVIQNLKNPAIVEKIVGEEVDIVSRDPGDLTGRTIRIAFEGEDGEPLDKLMEHALKVATPNAGGTNTPHALWEARLGHPVEDFKPGEKIHTHAGTPEERPRGGASAKPSRAGVPAEAGKQAAAAKAVAGEDVFREGSRAHLDAQRGLASDATIDKADAAVKAGGPLYPDSGYVGLIGLADQANAIIDSYDPLLKNFTNLIERAGFNVFIDEKNRFVELSGVMGERGLVGVTDPHQAKLTLLGKILARDVSADVVGTPADGGGGRVVWDKLPAHTKGSLLDLVTKLDKQYAFDIKGSRISLRYNPLGMNTLWEKSLSLKHANLDAAAGKMSPDIWNKVFSFAEFKPVPVGEATGSLAPRPPSPLGASGSIPAPALEATASPASTPGTEGASPSAPTEAVPPPSTASAAFPAIESVNTQPPSTSSVVAPAVEAVPPPAEAAAQVRAVPPPAAEGGPTIRAVKPPEGEEGKPTIRAVAESQAGPTIRAVEGGVEQKYTELLNTLHDSRGIDPHLAKSLENMKVSEFMAAMEKLAAQKDVGVESAFHQAGAGQYSREQYELLSKLVEELKPVEAQKELSLKAFLTEKWYKK